MSGLGTPTDNWDDFGVSDTDASIQNSDNGSQDEWSGWGSSPNQDTYNVDGTDNQAIQQDGATDWDDWGSEPSAEPTQSQDESWANWDNGTNQQQMIQPEQNDWQGWGNQGQQDVGTQGNFIPQEQGGWDNWQGNQQGMMQNQTADEGFTDFANNLQGQNPVQEVIPRQFNFSMKTIAIIIAGVFILIAFILLGVSKIHITKKPKQPTQQTQVQQQQTQQSNQTQQSTQNVQQSEQPQQGGQPAVNVSEGSVTIVEIPDSMVLNYSMDNLEANGTVRSKMRYVQGHQILYCVVIDIKFAGSSETVNYYCNYAAYNQVSEGDLVFITYQQVNDSYISVVSIKK